MKKGSQNQVRTPARKQNEGKRTIQILVKGECGDASQHIMPVLCLIRACQARQNRDSNSSLVETCRNKMQARFISILALLLKFARIWFQITATDQPILSCLQCCVQHWQISKFECDICDTINMNSYDMLSSFKHGMVGNLSMDAISSSNSSSRKPVSSLPISFFLQNPDKFFPFANAFKIFLLALQAPRLIK